MTEFFKTIMGRRFFESTMPALVRAIERAPNALNPGEPLMHELVEMNQRLDRIATALERIHEHLEFRARGDQ